jgi:hypothetical protein
VLSLNPGAGGTLAGSTSCGAVLQVPTHTSAAPDTPVEDLPHTTNMNSSPVITVKAMNECLKYRKRLEREMFCIKGLLNIVGYPPFLFKYFQ